jgi:hypothetical protein
MIPFNNPKPIHLTPVPFRGSFKQTRGQTSQTSHDEVSMLVIGTENRMIYILDSNALNLAAKVKLEAVPTFISVLGLFDVEYRTGRIVFMRCETL